MPRASIILQSCNAAPACFPYRHQRPIHAPALSSFPVVSASPVLPSILLAGHTGNRQLALTQFSVQPTRYSSAPAVGQIQTYSRRASTPRLRPFVTHLSVRPCPLQFLPS